jgi:hypothetical protein
MACYDRAQKSQSRKLSPPPMMIMIGSVGMNHGSAGWAEDFRKDAKIIIRKTDVVRVNAAAKPGELARSVKIEGRDTTPGHFAVRRPQTRYTHNRQEAL